MTQTKNPAGPNGQKAHPDGSDFKDNSASWTPGATEVVAALAQMDRTLKPSGGCFLRGAQQILMQRTIHLDMVLLYTTLPFVVPGKTTKELTVHPMVPGTINVETEVSLRIQTMESSLLFRGMRRGKEGKPVIACLTWKGVTTFGSNAAYVLNCSLSWKNIVLSG